MSVTSEQVKELRDFAKNFWPIHPGDYEVREKMKKAVDVIEALSAKLQAANIEKPAGDCGCGWIPCKERLPEENQNVIACFAHGTVTELRYYNEKFHGIYSYDEKVIIAWQPMPEPYHEP